MSSTQPGPSKASPGLDCSEIANYESFMDSLITFMNETAHTIHEVRERSGSSPGAPVQMNSEEKQQKMKEILLNLSEKCVEEASTLSCTANTSAYQTALGSTAYDTAYSMPSSRGALPPSSEPPCACPPDGCPNHSTPQRQTSRGRRADTPRPGTTPVRGRVATPDQYFVPLTQSSPVGYPAPSPGSYRSGRNTSRGRGRSASPYSTLIDSGGMPYAYRSGAPAFDNITSQSGRGLSSYSNSPSSEWECECPPECSVNSTGRQQYRTVRGQRSALEEWKAENRTV